MRVNRVFDEPPATPGQFPWMALIVADYSQVFSGSLISDQWILTSAYYCSMYNLSSIILGVVNYTFNEEYPTIIDNFNFTCYVHELYDPYNVTNEYNIAMIKLLQPVTFTVNLMPIQLPSVNDATKDFTNVSMTVGGYVLVNYCFTYEKYQSSVTYSLKYEELQGISYTECAANLSAVYYEITLPESAICTGNSSLGSCGGVQGAPLFYKNQDGSWVIAGIVTSTYYYCYYDGTPTVFTRVSSNLDWIYTITGMGGSTSTPKATTGKPSTITIAVETTSSDANLLADSKQTVRSRFQNVLNVFDVSQRRDERRLNRVFEEPTATLGQFPWMAFLVSDYGDVSSGSLISDQWILTSAYYCSMINMSSIILGIIDYTYVMDFINYPTIIGNINYTCYVHELYNPYNVTNEHNIALIKMLQPVTFTVNIMPIQLPSVNEATKDFTNVLMTVGGFMSVSTCYDYEKERSSINFNLKYKELKGVSYTECSAVLSAIFDITLPESAICTGNISFKLCGSVQGAPLFYKNQNGSWVIAGIMASSPYYYCYDDYPTVFTRVSYNLDWISSTTGIALPGVSTSTPKATTGKTSTTTSSTKPTSRSTGKTTTTKPSSTKTTTKTTTKTSTKKTTKTTPKTSTTKKSSSTTKKASG
ncbi:Hypothetical predicted protein [Cloeon dipterum]|uniref:Peptidase S1 domain-containing protein n=1 Tax=Cloeon dipterum TaxID=197152 RepID=A0A8S1DMK5_9INSE|nr:Hypothetical predicted protein [Cloeon dipterum]